VGPFVNAERPSESWASSPIATTGQQAPEKIAGSPFNVALAARKSLGAVGKLPLEQARVQAGTFLAHAKWRHQKRLQAKPDQVGFMRVPE
jgi:hypothetical protein